ncbi:MAG: hypothetical protein PHG00_11860 [Methylococcales bacterium]|nr:hypothetical protein [Methylococcales bacterium]
MEPSHVMRAMDIPYTAAHGTIRFSFSRDNTMAEVDKVLEVMPGYGGHFAQVIALSEGNGPVANSVVVKDVPPCCTVAVFRNA